MVRVAEAAALGAAADAGKCSPPPVEATVPPRCTAQQRGVAPRPSAPLEGRGPTPSTPPRPPPHDHPGRRYRASPRLSRPYATASARAPHPATPPCSPPPQRRSSPPVPLRCRRGYQVMASLARSYGRSTSPPRPTAVAPSNATSGAGCSAASAVRVACARAAFMSAPARGHHPLCYPRRRPSSRWWHRRLPSPPPPERLAQSALLPATA